MTQAISGRRGQGEDSIYWDASKNRYVGAVSLGFSPAVRHGPMVVLATRHERQCHTGRREGV